MSGRHATEKERARQAESLAALKAANPQPTQSDDDDEVDTAFDPLDRNRVYTPKTLQQSLRVGRKIYEGLLAEGLPHSRIKGRYFFSGRLVMEFIESRTQTDGQQTG